MLQWHRDAYLGELVRIDYAASTNEPYSRAIGQFSEQVTARGLDAGEIDEAALAELQDAVPTLRSAKGQRGRRGCIARFIAHLVDTGVIAPPTPPVPGPRHRGRSSWSGPRGRTVSGGRFDRLAGLLFLEAVGAQVAECRV